MIAADKVHLEARLKQLSNDIRSRELSVFLMNMRVLGTQATFLCGLGFAMLYMTPSYIRNIHEGNTDRGFRGYDSTPEVIFAAVCSISIGLNVLVMLVSSWSMIFGQDLAYRGADGSLVRAVDGLYVERKYTLRLFYLAVFFVSASLTALGWLKTPQSVGWLFLLIIPLAAIGVFLYVRLRVRRRFKFPAEHEKKPNEFLISNSYDPERGRTTTATTVPAPPSITTRDS